MAIIRLLFLLVGAIAQLYTVNAPNVQPPAEQLREQRSVEPLISSIVLHMKMLIWTWAFLEGPVLFALSGYCPPALAQPLLQTLLPTRLTSDPAALASLTALTPAFIAGTLLALTGSLLRAHCFSALGPYFTFQLSIRPTHVLITNGMYSIVRHPSYTGFLANTVGYFLCALDPQGLIASMLAGLGHAGVTGALACMWATGLYLTYALLHGRMKREDAMLESRFGKEWQAWTKRVPYRLVPGIY